MPTGKVKIGRLSALRRFGYISAIENDNQTLGSRIGIFLHGTPFIGSFIRGLYFKKYVKKIKATKVLDAGCGSGEYASYLACRYPQMAIDAFDIDIEHCQAMQKKYNFENINFCKQDLSELSAIDKYDLIYSIDVLEHIELKEGVIQRFYRALKKGGVLYIHLPQKDWFGVHIFNPRVFKKFNDFTKTEHRGEQFSLEGFVEFLVRNNFKIIDKKKTFGFFGKLAWELDQWCQENNCGYLKAISIPFFKLLGFIDLIKKNKEGAGILVLAQK